jgi:predicted  nucleic acid-binding Zn-ribbon protein
MMDSEQHLKRIQDKLQLLLKHHANLQKENQALKNEMSLLKNQADEFHSATEKLRQQVEILKYTNGAEMDQEERKQFEKRISGYVKEIDRCIAMLSH